MLFTDTEKREAIEHILSDESFPIRSYGLRRVYLEMILQNEMNIQNHTAEKLRDIYNDYYHTNLSVSDIFAIKTSKLKADKTIEYVFSCDTTGNMSASFIETILSFEKNTCEPVI